MGNPDAFLGLGDCPRVHTRAGNKWFWPRTDSGSLVCLMLVFFVVSPIVLPCVVGHLSPAAMFVNDDILFRNLS